MHDDRMCGCSSCRVTRTTPSSGTGCWNQVLRDRKSTRLNSSHTEIYTLSLHDALPIFAVQLNARRPNVRVLFMSGYTDDAVVRHGMLEPGLAYLEKPFRPQTLLKKVRSVLQKQSR